MRSTTIEISSAPAVTYGQPTVHSTVNVSDGPEQAPIPRLQKALKEIPTVDRISINSGKMSNSARRSRKTGQEADRMPNSRLKHTQGFLGSMRSARRTKTERPLPTYHMMGAHHLQQPNRAIHRPSVRAPLLLSSVAVLAAGLSIATVPPASARSIYDGSWDLVFVTQAGACDPTYNFTVNINNGIVTHPNLVKFRGYVSGSGAVRASVTVHDKHASGTGRLVGTYGRGSWRGYAGRERCSGYWTAQKN